ncbi:hypothetical protein HKX48_004941 [Thoreauomyces humboldtii]|nr:hypothetical protein HKX48_004941 [Thoreauomyces humboldtii]
MRAALASRFTLTAIASRRTVVTTTQTATTRGETRPVTGSVAESETHQLIIPNPSGDNSIFEADACSGAAPFISARAVRIFRPARSAVQAGSAKEPLWRIDFDQQERWENSLMGWTSSHDAVQGVTMEFTTKEDAVRFALRQGYQFWVEEPKVAKFKVKTYADNFKYVPEKLRFIKTK